MRAIKAGVLLALIGIVGWALVNIGQMILGLYPDYKLWQLGAALACVYAIGDALDRSREWFGYRRDYAPRRRAWSPWH